MTTTTVSPDALRPEACGISNNIHKYVVPTHLLYENNLLERFSEVGSFGRLNPVLRNLVRRDAPVSAPNILSTAVLHLYNARHGRRGDIPREFFAFACADLAVTGRRAYFGDEGDTPLSRITDFEGLARTIITRVQSDFPAAAETAIRSCINDIYRRVFQVAWCVAGPPTARTYFRERLGWITVSGEDDAPFRPVNAAASPYPQYNINVTLEAGSIRTGLPLERMDINTRLLVATNTPAIAPFPTEPTGLPTISPPTIPPPVGTRPDIIVFIHGHSSRAEEFEDIAPLILQQATERGRPLVFISLDLPCMGYTQKFNTERFLGDVSTSREIDINRPSQAFPGLEFMEEYICRFIETLGIEDRVLAIIGGSLGGNMTLRLGRRTDARRIRFIQNIISWSAASVWDSFLRPDDPADLITKKIIALNAGNESLVATRTEAADPRLNDPARVNYFNNVFIEVPLEIIVTIVRRQPDHWYRETWQPCKAIHIENAILERQEIYHPYFRQMHWRIAIEQLIFSQNLMESGRPLYTRNRARTLLLAGEADNYIFTNIYDATATLARGMTDTLGECLLVTNTGHSIHNERPRWFSDRIVNFLLT